MTDHLVVDGSNIATEGRSTPSLAQLEGAMTELRHEYPDASVTVVVDATFAHRIDQSEHDRYEAAASRGEFVSPPAGAIGRGDAFLLRIAEKVDGTVLSNDSFQEFHGEHTWLFERGRLLGATPVPGVGWIFTPRAPVRGPRSRAASSDARRERARVQQAIAEATKEVVEDDAPPAKNGTVSAPKDAVAHPRAINDPMNFITFIANHQLGERVAGIVDQFTAHGAVVLVGELRCYVPLSNLATTPPRSARAVLKKGEERQFVITALDPYRRGIELSLPGIGTVSGHPIEETVEGELDMARARVEPTVRNEAAAGPRRSRRQLAAVDLHADAPSPVPRKASTKRPAKAAPSAAKSSPKPAVPAPAATAEQHAPAPRRSPAKKAANVAETPAASAPAKKVAKKSAPKKLPAKKAAAAVRPAKATGGQRKDRRAMNVLPRPDELIPHRPPFLLLSEILELRPGEFARGNWRLDASESFFAGHFPGRPTVPGVMMVESLAQLGAAAVLADDRFAGRLPLFGGIDKARFRRQVSPGDVLELEVAIGRLSKRAGTGHGIARVGGEIACETDLFFVLVEA